MEQCGWIIFLNDVKSCLFRMAIGIVHSSVQVLFLWCIGLSFLKAIGMVHSTVQVLFLWSMGFPFKRVCLIVSPMLLDFVPH